MPVTRFYRLPVRRGRGAGFPPRSRAVNRSSDKGRRGGSADIRDIRLDDVERHLDGPFTRGQQLIHVALALGVLMFLGVIVVLAVIGSSDAPGDDATVPQLLSYIHPLLLITALAAGHIARNSMLHPARLTEPNPRIQADGAAQLVVMKIAAADLVRLALLEGCALFGLVILLISHLGGVLSAQPLYWFNAASAVIMVAFVAMRFPNKERYLETVRQAQVSGRELI